MLGESLESPVVTWVMTVPVRNPFLSHSDDLLTSIGGIGCYGSCFGNGGPSPWECSHTGCYASGKEHGIAKAAWESRQTWTDHPGKLGLLSADPLGHDFLGRAHAHCR